ncbi:MAG: hypothetical protein EOP88_12410 [Verrucomicrobiaceae bacterium]|nr:MAG: hypothetical protein EOP88_12410 [Verrucomicrobiaceae bacterium]
MKASILSLLVAVSSPLLAGPCVPAQVPSDAKWLVHADFDAMRDSRTGQAVFSLLEADQGKRLRAVSAFLAMQPLTSLHGITLYGSGTPGQAAALVDGKFDRALLENLVRTTKGYAGFTHAGHTVHSWVEEGAKQHAAFASDNLLVFSRDEEGLKKALDTLQVPSPPSTSPLLTADEGKPLVVARARFSEMTMPDDLSRLVRTVKGLRLAASEADGRFTLRASAEAETGPDADRLRRMVDGVLAFAQVQDAKLEGLDLKAELDSVTQSPVFSATLSLPVGEWIGLLEKGAQEAVPAQ